MQRLVGRVLATALPKTCTVVVERRVPVPKNPNKLVSVRKKYLAHDEKSLTIPGDVVTIEYWRKMSSRKAFIVTEVLKSARTWVDPITGRVYTHF